jgi:DNA-binding transcriptional MerR regulator
MADNLETPDFGNFSIQSTVEGMGSQELLNDLLGPDTSTANPDDIQDINTPDPEPAAAAPKKKAPVASTEDEPADDKKEDEKKSITDFLYDDDTEEEEEAPAAAAPKADATPEEDEEEAPASTQFAALSNDLFKLGVFTKDDEEEEINISTPEEFLERFEAEKKKGAIEVVNNFIGQFGEDYQNAFQSIFVNGVNPKDYFSTYNAIENFSEMDLSDEGNQVAVIKQALADQGFDPEDITSEVERLKNYGDLESVAAKHHKVLIKKEATKLQKLEQERAAQLQQQAAIKQQYQQNVATVLQEKVKAKEFDGIPLNPKLATELQDFLLAEKWKTPSGETLTDFDRTILDLKRPENHALKVKVGLLLKILEKDPTLSTIQKSGISKKSNELFGEVARQASKSSVKSKGSSTSPTSWFA